MLEPINPMLKKKFFANTIKYKNSEDEYVMSKSLKKEAEVQSKCVNDTIMNVQLTPNSGIDDLLEVVHEGNKKIEQEEAVAKCVKDSIMNARLKPSEISDLLEVVREGNKKIEQAEAKAKCVKDSIMNARLKSNY